MNVQTHELLQDGLNTQKTALFVTHREIDLSWRIVPLFYALTGADSAASVRMQTIG